MIYCSLPFVSIILDSGFREPVHLFLPPLNRALLDVYLLLAQFPSTANTVM